MKKIDVSAITSTNGLPIKGGTWKHLQAAYQEALAGLGIGLVGDNNSNAYILWGCVNSGSGTSFVISAGAIFLNGEVYQVPSVTFTATLPDVAVGTITTTFFSEADADPVTFTDGVARNVHQNRQIVFGSGLSSSSDCNFTDLKPIYANIQQVNITGPSVSGTYPNKVIGNPIPGVLYTNTTHLGDLNRTPVDGNTVLLTGGSNTFAAYHATFPAGYTTSANYKILAMIRNPAYNSSAQFINNFNLSLQIGETDTNSFYFAIGANGQDSNTQDIYVDYFLIQIS